MGKGVITQWIHSLMYPRRIGYPGLTGIALSTPGVSPHRRSALHEALQRGCRRVTRMPVARIRVREARTTRRTMAR